MRYFPDHLVNVRVFDHRLTPAGDPPVPCSGPEPAGSGSRPRVAIDHLAYPHVFDTIFGFSTYRSLLALRGSSRALRDKVDAHLLGLNWGGLAQSGGKMIQHVDGLRDDRKEGMPFRIRTVIAFNLTRQTGPHHSAHYICIVGDNFPGARGARAKSLSISFPLQSCDVLYNRAGLQPPMPYTWLLTASAVRYSVSPWGPEPHFPPDPNLSMVWRADLEYRFNTPEPTFEEASLMGPRVLHLTYHSVPPYDAPATVDAAMVDMILVLHPFSPTDAADTPSLRGQAGPSVAFGPLRALLRGYAVPLQFGRTLTLVGFGEHQQVLLGDLRQHAAALRDEVSGVGTPAAEYSWDDCLRVCFRELFATQWGTFSRASVPNYEGADRRMGSLKTMSISEWHDSIPGAYRGLIGEPNWDQPYHYPGESRR